MSVFEIPSVLPQGLLAMMDQAFVAVTNTMQPSVVVRQTVCLITAERATKTQDMFGNGKEIDQ